MKKSSESPFHLHKQPRNKIILKKYLYFYTLISTIKTVDREIGLRTIVLEEMVCNKSLIKQLYTKYKMKIFEKKKLEFSKDCNSGSQKILVHILYIYCPQ